MDNMIAEMETDATIDYKKWQILDLFLCSAIGSMIIVKWDLYNVGVMYVMRGRSVGWAI